MSEGGTGGVESGRQPFHFRPVGRGLFGNHDVAAGEDCGKAIKHALRPAENLRAVLRVDLTQPGSESDAAGNIVEFRNDKTFGGENQIGPQHGGHCQGEGFFPLQGDQFGRFAAIEEIGDPGGFASVHAEAVQLIAGADEKREPVAELVEFPGQLFLKRKRIRRDPPGFFVEESAFRQRGLDRFRALQFFGAHARIFKASRTSSSVGGVPVFPVRACLTALCASTCL